MTAHPKCDKCGGEILPGQEVDIITDLDLEETRIIMDPEFQMLMVHHDPSQCGEGAEG